MRCLMQTTTNSRGLEEKFHWMRNKRRLNSNWRSYRSRLLRIQHNRSFLSTKLPTHPSAHPSTHPHRHFLHSLSQPPNGPTRRPAAPLACMRKQNAGPARSVAGWAGLPWHRACGMGQATRWAHARSSSCMRCLRWCRGRQATPSRLANLQSRV